MRHTHFMCSKSRDSYSALLNLLCTTTDVNRVQVISLQLNGLLSVTVLEQQSDYRLVRLVKQVDHLQEDM